MDVHHESSHMDVNDVIHGSGYPLPCGYDGRLVLMHEVCIMVSLYYLNKFIKALILLR